MTDTNALLGDAPKKSTQEFDLADLIVRNSYSYAGVICHPDEADEDAETRAMEVDDVMASVPAHQVVDALRQALTFAIPAALREEYTRDRCDTCDTPFLRCVEKGHDTASNTPVRCCTECSHESRPVASNRFYSLEEWTSLLTLAATGAPTIDEAADSLEREADAADAHQSLVREVMGTAVNIGLDKSRRTLAELQSAADRHPETAGLIAAWEEVISRLEELAGPAVPSRKREASDG